MEDLVEIASSLVYGGAATKKAVELLEGYSVKSTEEVRRELSAIRGSLAEEIVRARYAE